MNNKIKTFVLLPLFAISLLALGGLAYLYTHLYLQVEDAVSRKALFEPFSIYSDPLLLDSSNRITQNDLQNHLTTRKFLKKEMLDQLLPGEFFVELNETCKERLQLTEDANECWWIRPNSALSKEDLRVVIFNAEGQMLEVLSPAGPAQLILSPLPIAQTINNELILSAPQKLAEIPPQCLFAVLAIEDQNFLKHPGVSWRGFARAALNNLTGGPRQGGSTITQQLVKNDILTPERTLERKAKELIMAIILEHKLSKDEILEKYLNIIYFGQNGPYQVRGLGAAAQFYFDQELKTLNLAQCSLLAAILNSPGLFDPERKAEAALKRRNLVLQKMRELNWINDSEQKEALAEPAPKRTSRTLAFQNFQYFIEAAVQSRASDNKGADINLSLQSSVQNQLQKIMNEKLPEIQLKARELSKKKDLKIEAAVVVVDLHFGQVVAATGGQQFLKSPFNRLIHARRPIGSIIKPFVYHYLFSENKDLDAQSEMQDEPFTYKFSGQQWTPENYNNKHLGQVPLFYAFKESLNTPLVKMVAENNFNGVFTHLQSFGFTHKDNPSVVLGAIELSPWEVAKVYFQLLNQDQKISEPSFELQTHSIRQFDPYSPETAMVINLMQNVVQSGTAKSAGGVSWQSEVAGKTGTTSDYKDSWFVGFNERYLTVVWVGSDQNVKTGLTGASGALPIWIGLQKYLDQITKPLAFSFPDTVEKKQIEDTFANQEITILKRD